MNYVKVLSGLLFLCVVDISEAGDRSKIFNGLREIPKHKYPNIGWILIGQKRVHCGAILISTSKALTAASCITDQTLVAVIFGDHSRSNITQNEQVFNIDNTVIHPNFNSTTYEYDVAVLSLTPGVATLNQYVNTFDQLADDSLASYVLTKRCRVVGWGYEVAGASDLVRDQSDVPYEITVTQTANCSHVGAGMNSICYTPFRDQSALTCQGDVGGAFLCKKRGEWVVAGVMSGWMVGEGCTPGDRAVTTIPSVITWIAAQL